MICQRCAKDVPNIHTCSPSDLVRKLEAEVASAIAYNRNLQDAIEAYRAEVAELRKDAERYWMKRRVDFKAGKATNEDRWNKGYDAAVDYCIKYGLPRPPIDAALAKDSSHE